MGKILDMGDGVGVVVDVASESMIVGEFASDLPAPKEDEVFEEAVEDSLDDEIPLEGSDSGDDCNSESEGQNPVDDKPTQFVTADAHVAMPDLDPVDETVNSDAYVGSNSVERGILASEKETSSNYSCDVMKNQECVSVAQLNAPKEMEEDEVFEEAVDDNLDDDSDDTVASLSSDVQGKQHMEEEEVMQDDSEGIGNGDCIEISRKSEGHKHVDDKPTQVVTAEKLEETVAMPDLDPVVAMPALDVSDKIENVPASEQKEGDKTVNGDAYMGSNSGERGILASEKETSKSCDGSSLLKNKECVSVAPDSGIQYASIDQAQLNGESVSSSCNSAEAKHTAASAVSSTAKSANPILPPRRPIVLGRSTSVVSRAVSQRVEEVEEVDETREKLQMIRVKFLRLAHRLGKTPHDDVIALVLYRLGLVEQLRGYGSGFSYDRANAMAEQLEKTGLEPLDFECTILFLGKTGVGKTATINSIFDEVKLNTDPFDSGTKKVQLVEGIVHGIKVRIIDTPGLFPSWTEQRKNMKILNSVKKFMKKTPPDIILYLDRLDMPSSDMPLLKTITDVFEPSIWLNTIVVLTHAASEPPEGPNGTSLAYEVFENQRRYDVQQAIRQVGGGMRLDNPVSLVENHTGCITNRAGERVLPNGKVWKRDLLLLSFASKIQVEVNNTLLKLQATSMPGNQIIAHSRALYLPMLVSSLLQSRPKLKLPDQFGEDGFVDDSSDSDEEDEYDELPPFRSLTNAQLAKLTKEQKKAYSDEVEYRERLFIKKHRKMARERANLAKDMDKNVEEEESSSAAYVIDTIPGPALPVSFGADDPSHRYRQLDTSNQWLVRQGRIDEHGWDNDVGFEGINVERLFVVKDGIPVSFSGQVSKEKKEASLQVQMEVASSIKHGKGKGTTLGLDIQGPVKEMAYTLRSETLFITSKRNKATAGLSVTRLGDEMAAGLKLEDKLAVSKQLSLAMSGGSMIGCGDFVYGGALEATFRGKDPLSCFLSSLGISVLDQHGNLAVMCNVQSQIPLGRSTNLVARANVNRWGYGQVSIRLNSSEHIQFALIGLIPLLQKLINKFWPSQQY